MITLASQMGMKILIGCMTETSFALSEAAQLSPLVDRADLDEKTLINNDVYKGMTVTEGRVTPATGPGQELIKKSNNL